MLSYYCTAYRLPRRTEIEAPAEMPYSVLLRVSRVAMEQDGTLPVVYSAGPEMFGCTHTHLYHARIGLAV
jgi:hypothetical protein